MVGETILKMWVSKLRGIFQYKPPKDRKCRCVGGGGVITHRSAAGHVITEVWASYRSSQVIFGDSRSSFLQYLIKICKAEF